VSEKGNKPDYDLSVKNKATEESCRVGAGWLNPGGSISIRLNLLTVLTSDREVLITLFPKNKE